MGSDTTPPRPAPADLLREPRDDGGGREQARWVRMLILGWFALSWALVAVLAWLTLSLWLGFTRPATFTVPLQGITPFVYLPVWICAIAALASRRWLLAGCCVALAIVHVAVVVSALGSNDVPAWAASAPRLRLLSANLYDSNPTPDAAARRIRASKADVLALVEVSPQMRTALTRAGVDAAYPYRVLADPGVSGDTDGLYSKIPFDNSHVIPIINNELPAAKIRVADRPIEIVAVHIDSAIGGGTLWRKELEQLKRPCRSASGPLVLTGDFNATRWHPPFADVMSCGLTDAHKDRGEGLSRSWPVAGSKWWALEPIMRLDHALVNDSVSVIGVHDIVVAGSDHLAFEAELAVGR